MDRLYSAVWCIRQCLLRFFNHKTFTFEKKHKDSFDNTVHSTLIRAKRDDNIDGIFRIRYFNDETNTVNYALVIGATKGFEGVCNEAITVSNDDGLPLFHLANMLCGCYNGMPIAKPDIWNSLKSHPWVRKWCSEEAIEYWLRDANIPAPKQNPGNIILLVGASGSGKSTVEERLVDRGLRTVCSYTTRLPRYEGEDCHIFLDKFIFEKAVDMAGGIEVFKENCVAYTYFDGNHYYATPEQADEADIYVMDPDGVEWFRNHYKGEKNAIVVYLYCSMPLRYARMATSRGESEAKKRIAHDEKVFNTINLNKIKPCYIVDNSSEGEQSLEKAVNEIYDIWKGEDAACMRIEKGEDLPITPE